MSMPVQDYYDEQAEAEWQRLERHRMEYAISMRVLGKHLPPPPGHVLDIGGGPGRYAIALAQQGYTVTLCDLSPTSLRLAEQKAQEAGVRLEGYRNLNSLDLTSLPAESCDAVLLMGPLYHLLELAERQRAMAQASRCLRPGGLLFASVITRFAPFRDATCPGADWTRREPAYTLRMYETGRHDNGDGFTRAHFAHPDELEPLMRSAGLHTQGIYGLECILGSHDKEINQLSGADWDFWVELIWRMSPDASLLGNSDHVMAVGKKDPSTNRHE
jgi:S-adenosylmethionine-dependent methyltransferase